MNSCSSCRGPKLSTECEVCLSPLCRKCVQFLAEETFAFLPERPEVLKKLRFCPGCYDAQVAPELASYEEILGRAKEVTFLTKAYKGFIPVLKKSKTDVRIASCVDRDELILRLAFLAARDGYNALIQADVASRKLRDNGYQKSEWSGSAIPAVIDEAKLRLNEYREEVWRRGH